MSKRTDEALPKPVPFSPLPDVRKLKSPPVIPDFARGVIKAKKPMDEQLFNRQVQRILSEADRYLKKYQEELREIQREGRLGYVALSKDLWRYLQNYTVKQQQLKSLLEQRLRQLQEELHAAEQKHRSIKANKNQYTPESYAKYMKDWLSYTSKMRAAIRSYRNAIYDLERASRVGVSSLAEIEKLRPYSELERRGLVKITADKKTGEIIITVAKPPDKLTDKEIRMLEDAGFTFVPTFEKAYQVKVPIGEGEYETRTFRTEREAQKFIEKWQQETMRRLGWKGTWEELQRYWDEQERRLQQQQALLKWTKGLNPIFQFLQGLVNVPYSTFIAPFTGGITLPLPSEALVGLVQTGKRGKSWEALRPVATQAGERARQKLSELGAAYIAGGITGELAQALLLGELAGKVGSVALKYVGRHLPYTWQVRLGIKPSPFVSETGIEPADAFQIVMKGKKGWRTLTIKPRMGTGRETFPLVTTRGTTITPFSQTLERVVGSGKNAQIVQQVIQQEAAQLQKILSQAGTVKMVTVTIPEAVKGGTVITRTVQLPVYDIKPEEITRVKKALQESAVRLNNIISLIKTPSTQVYVRTIPKLKPEIFEDLYPVLDEDVLEQAVPDLRTETLTKVLPVLSKTVLEKTVPKLKTEKLAKTIPLLAPKTLERVISKLSAKQLSKIASRLSLATIQKILPKLTEEQKANFVLGLTPTQLEQVIPKLKSDTVVKIIPLLTLDQLELLIPKLDEPTIRVIFPKLPEEFKKKILKVKPSKRLEFYKVTFRYSVGAEKFKVKARSFREALVTAWRLRRQRVIPYEAEVKRVG